MVKKKNIIVTGGAGFVGSNIAAALAEANNVLLLDNLHTGVMENVNALVKEGAQFFKADSGQIAEARFDPDLIFHVGMYSSTPMYRKDPSLIGRVVSDAVNVFKYASERDVPVVFASSSSIYNGHTPPHSEDMVPKVTDFYTEARLAVERLAELYNSMHGLTATGLRMFSIYGPHDERKGEYGNLITQFMLNIGRGETPVVYGDGTQTRDFTYIDDVVDAFIRASDLKGFNILNVGRGENFTINQMLGKLGEHLGVETRPKYIANPLKNYVEHLRADTGKAEKVLGFRARHSLDEGIGKMHDYLIDAGLFDGHAGRH